MIDVDFYIVFTLFKKYIKASTKEIDRMADLFLWPVVSIILWGFISIYLDTDFDLTIGSLILGSFIFYLFLQRGQMDIPIFILDDFWADSLSNKYSCPITKWDIYFSVVIFSLIRSLFVLFLIVFIAYIGFNFLFFINPMYLFLYLFSLSIFFISMGTILLTLILRFGMSVQVTVWGLSFIMQPFMAVFYPIDALPQIFQIIARLIPASYVFEGLRYSMSTFEFSMDLFLFSLISNLFLLFFSAILYSKAFDFNKESGGFVNAR